jgi:hypothetical protein
MLALTGTCLLELEIYRADSSFFVKVLRSIPIEQIQFVKRNNTFLNYICFGVLEPEEGEKCEVELINYIIVSVDSFIEKLAEIVEINEGFVETLEVYSEEEEQAGNLQKLGDISSSDISREELLSRIAMLENQLETDLDFGNIQLLIQYYGKATEVFSDDPNSNYMIFPKKTQALLSRGDIQAVIESNEQGNKQTEGARPPIVNLQNSAEKNKKTLSSEKDWEKKKQGNLKFAFKETEDEPNQEIQQIPLKNNFIASKTGSTSQENKNTKTDDGTSTVAYL